MLARVAAELPRGRVDRQTIICRAPHAFPLATGATALTLGDVDRFLGAPGRLTLRPAPVSGNRHFTGFRPGRM